MCMQINGRRRRGLNSSFVFFFASRTCEIIETVTGGMLMMLFLKIFGAIVGIWAAFKLAGIAIGWLDMLFDTLKPKDYK